VTVACDENGGGGSSKRSGDDGVAPGMAPCVEARGLEQRLAEIEYEHPAGESARFGEEGGFEYGRFPQVSSLVRYAEWKLSR
jgi:hypothetical protein